MYTNEDWRKDYKIEKRKIKSVTISKEKGAKARMYFKLDGAPFRSYDPKTGEKIEETNSFSLDLTNVTLQCEDVAEFQTANLYLLGSPLTPILISSVLTNAVVSVNRIFKAKGEKREKTNDTYTSDLYKTVFAEIETHMDTRAEAVYNKELDRISKEAEKANTTQEETTKANVAFGVLGWNW